MNFPFSHFKKEKDAEDLWRDVRKIMEEGQQFANKRNAIATPTVHDEISEPWFHRQEEQFMAEMEKNY